MPAGRRCRAPRTRSRARRCRARSGPCVSSASARSMAASSVGGVDATLVDAERRTEIGRLDEQRAARGARPPRAPRRARAPSAARVTTSNGTTGMPASRSSRLQTSLSMQTAAPSTPTPDVGDVEHVEQALDGAVLAVRPVQDREDDVELGQDARRDRGGSAARSGRRAGPGPPASRRPPVDLLVDGPVRRPPSSRCQPPARSMPTRTSSKRLAIERVDDVARRANRDRVLPERPPKHHTDAQAAVTPSAPI